MSIRVLLFKLRTVALLCALVSASAHATASPFGINGCSWSHLGMNTDKFDREAGLKRLRALKEAGAKWDRCDFWWGRIEPEKGKFLWRDVDWVVEQYVKHDVQLMPILCYGSAWQKSDAPVTDDERAIFARYVYETVKRYKKHVHVWEIWNEPNITPFWAPNPDVKEYAKLLKVAYEAAKRADPDCTVVGAATAGTDFAFIEGLLLAGGGEHMDVVSIHPYQGDLGSLSPDKGGLADQIRGVQKLLAEHGYRKPIWLTEIGHRTTGTHGHTSVTEEQQAAYLVRTYVIALASGAERVFWFNLQDWEEYWGIVRQNYERKPSFEAYRNMVKQLDGRRVVGTLDTAQTRTQVVFGRRLPDAKLIDPVTVSWSAQDDAMPIMARESATGVLANLRPLPAPPPLSSRKHVERRPPALPEQLEAWHDPELTARFAAAFAPAEPLALTTPFIIPSAVVPAGCADAKEFVVFEAGAAGKIAGQWDLDGNVVFLASPSDTATRTFYVYPTMSRTVVYMQTPGQLSNALLTVHVPGNKFIKAIQLKNGYTTRSDETDGVFSASYQDTAGAWPRTGAQAELIEAKTTNGPVQQQQRSRLRFGKDDCEYEFTVTIYADLPRVSYVGRWISPGKGATKQVNLGDSFPAGTVVTGMYGGATLPSAGVGYGPACVIRPGDHPTVTAVMVSNSGRLNTPGWATRSVVGAGLLYQTSFPATVSAEYFWYEKIPAGDLSQVAREHYLNSATPPAVTVGPVEARPPAAR